MIPKPTDVPNQPRPKGHSWPTSPQWKEAALERMRELGISRAELSRLCKVSDAAITTLFKPETETSRLVPAIHKVLKWPPPAMMPVWLDVQRGHLEAVWSQLSEDDKQVLLNTALKFALRNK